jgi:hypothetical protein
LKVRGSLVALPHDGGGMDAAAMALPPSSSTTAAPSTVTRNWFDHFVQLYADAGAAIPYPR